MISTRFITAQLSNYDSSAAQDGTRMDSMPAEPVMHAHAFAADGLHLAERQRARPAGDNHTALGIGAEHLAGRAAALCGCGGINFQPRAIQRGQRHRPGVQPPDEAVNLAGAFRPVNHGDLFIQHMRVTGFAVVLRLTGKRAFRHPPDGIAKQRGGILRQTAEQLPGGFAFADCSLALGKHRAGVQSLVHLHDGNAGFPVPGNHRPLDRGRAAPAGQQRAVRVDAAQPGIIQHIFR